MRRCPDRPGRDLRRAREPARWSGAARPGAPVRRRAGRLALGRGSSRPAWCTRSSATSLFFACCSTSRSRPAATDVTINVGHFRPRDERRPFASTHAAAYRGHLPLGRPRPLPLGRRDRPIRQPALPPLPRSDRLWAAGAGAAGRDGAIYGSRRSGGCVWNRGKSEGVGLSRRRAGISALGCSSERHFALRATKFLNSLWINGMLPSLVAFKADAQFGGRWAALRAGTETQFPRRFNRLRR